MQERVWTAVPAYLQAVDAYADAVERRYRTEDQSNLPEVRQQFELTAAKAELVAPEGVRPILATLRWTLEALVRVEEMYGAESRAFSELEELALTDANARRPAECYSAWPGAKPLRGTQPGMSACPPCTNRPSQPWKRQASRSGSNSC